MMEGLLRAIFGGSPQVPVVRNSMGENARTPYEAASMGPRTKTWRPADVGPQVVVERSAGHLRVRARDAYRNDATARAIVNAHVSNLVGTGIKPIPRIQDPALRRKVLALWDAWQERADTTGTLNFYQMQALAARLAYVDGECFVRLRSRKPEDKVPAGFQLQVLEAEVLDAGYSDVQKGIRAGVEFDPVGRPTAYHLFKGHPLEPGTPAGERSAVPAESVLHVFEPERPSQVRGVSRLAAALVPLQQLASFTDAHLRRQHLANLPSVFITAPQDDGPFPLDDEGDITVESGQPVFLQPGQDVRHNEPIGAEASFASYVQAVRRGICAGLGIPYEVAFSDLGTTNDRGMRAILAEYRRACRAEQWRLVHQLCDPVWSVFSNSEEALALTKPVGARWTPESWPYVNPTQDVAAKIAAKEAGFTSRSAIVGENGDDVEDVDAENKADADREAAMGLTYGAGKAGQGGL